MNSMRNTVLLSYCKLEPEQKSVMILSFLLPLMFVTALSTPDCVTTGTFTASGIKQTCSISSSGFYAVVAFGAQGGNVTDDSGDSFETGGEGAMAQGHFFLPAGTTLVLDVGSSGGDGIDFLGGGGGGGSFVFNNDILLVAGGGGGGGGDNDNESIGSGGDGKVESIGDAGYGNDGGPGGMRGEGGFGGQYPSGRNGGGGAGVYGNGTSGLGADEGFGGGDQQYDFAGGRGYNLDMGGFGGGGGGGKLGGGGGGGYAGGGGGVGNTGDGGGGGGGGSLVNVDAAGFVAGTDTTLGGVQSGNGIVVVTFLTATGLQCTLQQEAQPCCSKLGFVFGVYEVLIAGGANANDARCQSSNPSGPDLILTTNSEKCHLGTCVGCIVNAQSFPAMSNTCGTNNIAFLVCFRVRLCIFEAR
jgi:hypothetical protein